jgi:hypothetical protein
MFKHFPVIYFLLTCAVCNANYDFNDPCKKAYQSIVNLQFDAGKTLLENEKKVHPENLIPYYIENYIDFLSLAICEEREKYKALQSDENNCIDKLEDGNQASPYYRYCLAEVKMQWGFLRLKFGDYLSAAWELNKAYNLLQKNSELFPAFIPNHKGLGVLHAMIGAVPDEYKWIANIIGIRGTIKQGIDELSIVLNVASKQKEYDYLKPESIFLLTFLELNLLNNSDDLNKISNLIKDSSFISSAGEKPLMLYARASIDLKRGKNDEAIAALQQFNTSAKDYFPFYYLDYLTGVAKLNRMDKDAYKYFFRFLINFKGINYIKAAYQKLSWCYLLNDDLQNYKKYNAYVITQGSTLVDEDKQSLTDAKRGEIPNVQLLKARLLFDGGYYPQALTMLLQKKPSEFLKTDKDLLEFTYRLARIHHQNGNIASAISYYQLTIKNGTNKPYYFAANSALNLGLIYELQGKYALAQACFTQAMNLKNTEYKNSIELKAKAGLNRIAGK